MKRILSLLLVLVLLLPLAGCIEVATPSNTSSQASISSPTVTTTTLPVSTEPERTPLELTELERTADYPVYVLDMVLEPGQGENEILAHLTETVRISFTNTSEDTWDQVCLRDYAVPNIDASHPYNVSAYPQEGIAAVTDIQGTPLSFSVKESDRSVIYVTLDMPLAPGERTTIAVDYQTVIPWSNNRLCWYYAGSSQTRSVCLSQAYPILAEYLADGWNEAPYIKNAECFYTPCGSYRANLTLPQNYAVISTGIAQQNTDGSWCLTADQVRDFCIIVGDNYKVLTAESEGVTIRSWYYATDIDGSDNTLMGQLSLQAAVDAIAAFTQAWGEYPYKELDVVEAPFGVGAMEYPGLVRISNLLGLSLDTPSDVQALQLAVAHETSHQWFYAVVGNDQYREAWLDESFAAFGELVYLEYLGASEADLAQYIADMDDPLPEQYINLAYDKYESEANYIQAVYQCGCVFLWQLRQVLGKDAFDTFMHDWYINHQFTEVTTEQFRKTLEQATNDDPAIIALLEQYLK